MFECLILIPCHSERGTCTTRDSFQAHPRTDLQTNRVFINGSCGVMRHTKVEGFVRTAAIVRSRATTGWPDDPWL